jgi:hypothetical protein|tara:strand:+ start:552 stop:725 length:174 start_codon:yes stop_codon:yes gene_type:complete
MKKDMKEIRKYINDLLKHLSHHCCSIDSKRHNEIIDLTHEIETYAEQIYQTGSTREE